METKYQNAKFSTGFIFWKVSNLHQRLQREALKDLDITPSQFSLLASYFYVTKMKGSAVSQSEVVAHTGLDKMLVSDLTKVLIAKKLLVRKASKLDKRMYENQLSDHGKSVCNKALKIIEELDDGFFAKSGNKRQFLDLLLGILQG